MTILAAKNHHLSDLDHIFGFEAIKQKYYYFTSVPAFRFTTLRFVLATIGATGVVGMLLGKMRSL